MGKGGQALQAATGFRLRLSDVPIAADRNPSRLTPRRVHNLQSVQVLPLPPAGGGLCGEQPPLYPPQPGSPQGASTPSSASTVPRRCYPSPFVSGSNIRGAYRPLVPSPYGGLPFHAGEQASVGPAPVQRRGCPRLQPVPAPGVPLGRLGFPRPGRLRGVGGNVVLAEQNAPGRLSSGGARVARTSTFDAMVRPEAAKLSGCLFVDVRGGAPPRTAPVLPHRVRGAPPGVSHDAVPGLSHNAVRCSPINSRIAQHAPYGPLSPRLGRYRAA